MAKNKGNYRVWYDGDPEYTYFDTLAQALKHVRKTKALDESNSGLEECIDGYWDEWMDSDDQEIHDHLYMYGGKSPYLSKSAAKSEPVRPSIMDTVSFSREDIAAQMSEDEDDDDEDEEDAYDEIIDPEDEEEALDEEDLDERLMNVIGVSPKTTSESSSSESGSEDEEFIGEDEMSEFDDEDEDDLDEEDEEEEK